MVKVATVGYGYWGPNILRNFYGLSQCQLTTCCDLDQARLLAVRQTYPTVKTTTSYQEVLESSNVEAVALATPPTTHFSMARQALLNGKHVLVEKPLAMTSRECEDLIALADRQRLVLMVGHTFLYNPALLKVKELATPEHLGQTYYLYSQRVNLGRVQTDLNVLWSIAPHDISIALFLLGGMPVEVSAKGCCYLNERIHDVVFLSLVFPGGTMAHIHASWLDPSKVRRVTLVGSKRMIVYDDLADEGKVKVYDKGVQKVNGENVYGGFHYRLHTGDIFAPRIAMTEPLANECAHFIQCIRERKRPLTDGTAGLQVVKVLEAAQESLDNQGVMVKVGRDLVGVP